METFSVVSIICPSCGTELEPTADVCQECGASTASDRPDGNLMDRPWMLAIVVLHLGLIGIPLYWRTKYSIPIRLAIIGFSIVYTIFVVVVTIRVLRYVYHAFQG